MSYPKTSKRGGTKFLNKVSITNEGSRTPNNPWTTPGIRLNEHSIEKHEFLPLNRL